MFYIGIDIAKRSHQAAVTDVSGNIIVKPFNFKNTAAGFTQFLSVLETNSVSKDNCVIGLESTGHYWYPLYFFLVEQKFSVKVFNPIQTAAFREITIRKVKNDNLDSIMIADFTRFGRYSETYIPSENMLALKNLSRFRLSVCDICGSLKKRTIVLLDLVFPEYSTIFCDIFGTNSFFQPSEHERLFCITVYIFLPPPKKNYLPTIFRLTFNSWSSQNSFPTSLT